ncbi:UTP--glucose-1-phosphate uridylyltransferase [Dictyocoela muelleri]|nr:UTP--glucose-1-phosphate uridylyltransferase [Dictyocoela muelleri]
MISNKTSEREERVDILLECMKNELENMTDFKKHELTNFYRLYSRYLRQKTKKIKWSEIKTPLDKIVRYEDLSDQFSQPEVLLEKLAVLKLNGGLGTTMGCVGPKSAIQVRDGKNFLDLCVEQVDTLHKKYKVCVPLILMNSFNTEKQTKRMIAGYKGIRTFTQSAFPRISGDTFLPIDPIYGNSAKYPPGHGDIFVSLEFSGMLDQLLNEGKEYLFVSNIDNLAATVDFKILNYVIENDIDFLMEVTDKTRADIKGGTLIEYEGALTLLEIAQVPKDKKSEFTSVRKFKIFNTNSVLINLKSLKKLLKEKTLELDIIENRKKVPGIDEEIIQLETAMGAAIKYFPKSCGLVVPRRRFLPVKTCSDLFLIQSNLFKEDKGTLVVNPKRMYPSIPLIKLLGPNFNSELMYTNSFKSIPDILELDHLTVSGNVKFGKNVVLKGTVIIIADDNSTIQIPDGAILEDNILFGNLPIIEH